MYDYALDGDQVFALIGKMRCPTGNTTSIEIDAFRFESIMNVNMKRSLSEDEENKHANRTRISKDSFTSKINAKHKNRTKSEKDKRDIKEINGSSIWGIMENVKRDKTLPIMEFTRHRKTFDRKINSRRVVHERTLKRSNLQVKHHHHNAHVQKHAKEKLEPHR